MVLLMGPKYDGAFLHDKIKTLTRDVTVANTVTNVVVPAFDVKKMQPVIFTTYEAKKEPLKNAHLSDICISTAAAPTYFPAHHFTTRDDETGRSRQFHLVDGGVAANNPTMVAMSMLTREVLCKNLDFHTDNPAEFRRYLVVSVGTGAAKQSEKYTAPQCAKWGLLRWLYDGDFNPLIDILSHASSDMVDIHASVLFKALRCEEQYIRIQDETLTGSTSMVDVATKENMEALIGIGKKLLGKPVSRVNIDTGEYEPIDGGKETNEEALARFAGMLSEERRERQRALNSY
ncbi:hypothetical protein PR202_ga19927 [Eleusine coracana subsp. coracana]|uniref:Patatin n=1 Tax=Eleusine coracana subsp. coracana TaxID=191504 RepID=A0AAV5CX49_ELECO|nr:hypothetical protein PR202_ga19927 [Eleusine coracana subsp. coracana]